MRWWWSSRTGLHNETTVDWLTRGLRQEKNHKMNSTLIGNQQSTHVISISYSCCNSAVNSILLALLHGAASECARSSTRCNSRVNCDGISNQSDQRLTCIFSSFGRYSWDYWSQGDVESLKVIWICRDCGEQALFKYILSYAQNFKYIFIGWSEMSLKGPGSVWDRLKLWGKIHEEMKKWRKREFCHAVECRTGTGRQEKLPRRVGIETAENGGKFKSWESACPGTCKTGNKSKIDFHTSTQLTGKTRCIYFQIWLLGGPSPHSQLTDVGNHVAKLCFLRSAQLQNVQKESHLYAKLLF